MAEKTYTISNILGVDMTSSKYEVKANRAIEMYNMINIDGVNHKRHGYIERASLDGKINGIWEYGNIYIVHAGTKIYAVTLGTNSLYSTATAIEIPDNASIEDKTSWAIAYEDMLMIFCGYLLYCKKEEDGYKLYIAKDNKKLTYIPTTSISIDAEGTTEKVRLDFEAPNLLTKWRINLLQGMPQGTNNDEINRTYYLDTSVEALDPITIILETIENNYYKTKYYISTTVNDNSVANIVEAISSDGEIVIKPNGAVVGKLTASIGKIVFNDTIIATQTGEDNISVTFSHSELAYEDRISKCNFGTLFGLRGNNDRLFVAGNSTYKNFDFYSESNNYTYWPDSNYTVFGNNAPITGYNRINDGSMAVHMGQGDTSSIYYRSSSTESITDNSSGATILETVFPITAGAIGEYCMSPRSCVRLGGDTLYLSSGGVSAITLGNSIVVNERYSKNRSDNIKAHIQKRNHRNSAIAEVLDERAYFFIDNYCYIADSRYKYKPSYEVEDTFCYEWWLWSLPFEVTASHNLGNDILLGTIDGKIYSSGSERIDIGYIDYGGGQVTLNKENNTLTYNQNMSLFEDGEWAEIVVYSGTLQSQQGNIKQCWCKRTSSTACELYMTSNGERIALTSTTDDMKIAKVISTPIESTYLSPPLDLGNNITLKTITGISVVSDAESNSEFVFGYKINNGNREMAYELIGNFDFANIDFNKLHFGSSVFSTNSVKKVKTRSVNYIQFYMQSKSKNDCVINSITVTYNVTKKITKGEY